MSVEALSERTGKVQRVLVMPVVALGGALLLGGLVVGFPLLSGLGVAFVAAGAFGLWRLRVKAAEFNALLANPARVARIVPIVQRGGLTTNYPVVVVADDGKTYRIGTWEKSVEAAVAPFLQKFPQARGLESDSGFAPDDSYGVRFRIIGVLLGSLLIGLTATALVALPQTLAFSAQADEAWRRQVARNETEARALKEMASVELTAPWSACSVDSLTPSISVLLSGAKGKSYDDRRSGYLSAEFRLSLEATSDRVVYRVNSLEVLGDAMLGRRRRIAPPQRELGIVGARRGDTLVLRLLDLDEGKVLCEGTTRVGVTPSDSAYEENGVLAAAVMRPFCALMPAGTCKSVGVEPAPPAEVAAQPAPPSTSPKSVKPLAAQAAGGSLDPTSIQATVRAAHAKTRRCYEQALAKKPSLQGTLTVAFVIGRDGRVSSVQGSGFPDPTVTACVTKVFQSLRFATPQDGRPVPVRYPIVFESGR